MLACFAVIVKITRRRWLGGGPGGMARLIDDVVILLAAYHMAHDIVFGLGINIAFLLPEDHGFGSMAFDLVSQSSHYGWVGMASMGLLRWFDWLADE